jgi:hypothetical protein
VVSAFVLLLPSCLVIFLSLQALLLLWYRSGQEAAEPAQCPAVASRMQLTMFSLTSLLKFIVLRAISIECPVIANRGGRSVSRSLVMLH